MRNVFALSSILEPTGIRVEIARNGLEALQALVRSLRLRTGQQQSALQDLIEDLLN